MAFKLCLSKVTWASKINSQKETKTVSSVWHGKIEHPSPPLNLSLDLEKKMLLSLCEEPSSQRASDSGEQELIAVWAKSTSRKEIQKSLDLNAVGKESSLSTKSQNDNATDLQLMPKPKKGDLPQKICVVCDRPFTWRKKWAKCWEEVKYCSEKCRRNRWVRQLFFFHINFFASTLFLKRTAPSI